MIYRARNSFKRIGYIFAVSFLFYCGYHVFFKCTDTPLLVELAENQTWRPVDPDNTAFVFSAYLEEKNNKVVIVGALRKSPVIYVCQLWSRSKRNSMEMLRSYPTAITLPESHGRRFSVTLLECPFRQGQLPQYVSLVSNTCLTPTNVLRIRKMQRPDIYQRTFTVCLSPLHFGYSRDYELIEWIELNRILGAEKFIIYNYSSNGNIKNALEYYSKRGLVEVIQWRLPVSVDTFPLNTEPEIHYFAQSAALNDCLYRNKGESEFVVNIDLDEFIVPRGTEINTWRQMLTEVVRNYTKVFVFKNTYFRKDWHYRSYEKSQFRSSDKTNQYRLTTLTAFNREKKIYVQGVKSKYMAKTDGIQYLMIHLVPGLPPNEVVTVDERTGLLHHYRNINVDSHIYNDNITDYTVVEKFGDKLVENVGKVWRELPHVN